MARAVSIAALEPALAAYRYHSTKALITMANPRRGAARSLITQSDGTERM